MSEVGDSPTTIDLLSWCARAVLELVGQGGLGHSLDSLTNNSANEYGDALKRFV